MRDDVMTEPAADGALRRLVELRERRAAARAHGVVALLQRRPDLAGVYEPADLTAEAVRWSA